MSSIIYIREKLNGKSMPFTMNQLPYPLNALDPFIESTELDIHYNKYHRTYYDNFLLAIKDTDLESMHLTDLFKNITNYPDTLRNCSGGYFNHTFFWESLCGHRNGLPLRSLGLHIDITYGSFNDFKKIFYLEAKQFMGSGWIWLCVNSDAKLFISTTVNQNNPLMNDEKYPGIPLLALDLWEHSYYARYHNKRLDYVDAFWPFVNWATAEKRFLDAMKTIHT